MAIRILLVTVLCVILGTITAMVIAPVGSGSLYAAYGASFGLILAVVLLIMFVPTFIAYRREHPKRKQILLLNIFLGGFGVGWVIALIWACMDFRDPQPPAREFADRGP